LKNDFNQFNKSYTVKFELKHIVSPKEKYNGLSYGELAAIWCNWLFSDQHQFGSFCFLRGNVDNEPNVVMTGKNALTVYSDVAIFFPVICTYSSKLLNHGAINQMQRRKESTEPQVDATLLKVTINNTEIPNIHDYYVVSNEFILEINRTSPILRYFNPPAKVGVSEAVTAGYWMLLSPLPVGRYRINFEGRHRDGFRTLGDYSIKIIKRPS
jgi:hypothetical protein